MNRILLALPLCLGLGAFAHADGRVFPPDNCSTTNPFMAFTAIDGTNTYCVGGQNILTNALPGCGPGQIVSFNGTVFYCKDASEESTETQTPTIPDCAPGEVLTGSGGSLACVAQAGGEDGSWCGLGTQTGAGLFLAQFSCQGNPIATSGSGGALTSRCPTGYTLMVFATDRIEPTDPTGDYTARFYTCMKGTAPPSPPPSRR